MLLAFLIALPPSSVQIQAFDGSLWTGFDAGPCHIEADTSGAVAVWIGQSDPLWMTAAYSLIMKD